MRQENQVGVKGGYLLQRVQERRRVEMRVGSPGIGVERAVEEEA